MLLKQRHDELPRLAESHPDRLRAAGSLIGALAAAAVLAWMLAARF